MAKKRTAQQEPVELETEPETIVGEQPTDPEPTVEEPKIQEAPKPAKPAEAPQAPKRRIRIRKKATKKLSAAIICMDPSIQRFI